MRKLQLCRAPKIASLVPKSFNGVAAGLSFLVRELYESGSMLLHSQISRTFIQPYVNPRLPDCDTQVFSANHIPFFILHFRVVKKNFPILYRGSSFCYAIYYFFGLVIITIIISIIIIIDIFLHGFMLLSSQIFICNSPVYPFQ